jgi:hypothetical protein
MSHNAERVYRMHAKASFAARPQRIRCTLLLGLLVLIGMFFQSVAVRLSSFLGGLFLLAALLAFVPPSPNSPPESLT